MPKILLLDDDDDLLHSLADLMRLLGWEACLLAHSVDEMVALGAAALACELALLDINLGANQPSGLDAYRWLQARQFAGRIVFLTGHAQSHPLVAAAQQIGGSQVLTKPFVTDDLRRLLEK